MLVAASMMLVIVAATPLGDTTAAAAASAPAGEVFAANRRVYMMTDSVGLGAKEAVPAALPEYQVTVDGMPALFVEQLESKFLRMRMASSPQVLGDIAVVAGGYNYPFWDPGRFDRSIDSMIAALEQAGVEHIIWVTLREVDPQYISASAWKQVQPYFWYFPAVNQHLRAALGRHGDLTLADWAAIANQPGLTYDAIHLTAAGAATYSGLIADTVRNVADALPGGTTSKVTVSGINGVPADARAVAVNLTVTTPRANGFLTAYPCGIDRPATSNLNFESDQTVAVSAIVDVGLDRQICIYNSERTHVVVDVDGYVGAGSDYATISPTRMADTRETSAVVHPAGQVLAVPIAGVSGIPRDAAGVAITVTISDTTSSGFATAYPCDSPPAIPIALVNYIADTATPNFTIARPAADGSLCITTSTPASIIVDAFGYLPAGSSVDVSAAVRLADTRAGERLPAGTELVVPVGGQPGLSSSTAAAMVVAVTAASPRGVGFVVAYPCGAASGASTLNVVPDRATTNTAIVAPGANGAICLKSNIATHLLVDISARIFRGFQGLTPWRAYDSRTAAS